MSADLRWISDALGAAPLAAARDAEASADANANADLAFAGFEITAAVVAARGPVCATTGNLNNHLGVPLMLSRLQPAHRTAVIEMGANHLGDKIGRAHV